MEDKSDTQIPQTTEKTKINLSSTYQYDTHMGLDNEKRSGFPVLPLGRFVNRNTVLCFLTQQFFPVNGDRTFRRTS